MPKIFYIEGVMVELNELLLKISNNIEKVYFIHYACQSISDDYQWRSPRIASIEVLHYTSSQMNSFSIHLVAEELDYEKEEIEENYEIIEKAMLESFISYVSSREKDSIWIHWNMTNINYGFQAIEHRYKVITKKECFMIPEEHKINLSTLLSMKYGAKYCEEPKMQNLMILNGLIDKNFIAGKDEITVFKAKEYVKLHHSTMSKVYFFKEVYKRMISNKLVTNTNRTRYIVNKIYQNPVVQILGIIGAIGSIIGLIILII